jgi:DNA polymerase
VARARNRAAEGSATLDTPQAASVAATTATGAARGAGVEALSIELPAGAPGGNPPTAGSGFSLTPPEPAPHAPKRGAGRSAATPEPEEFDLPRFTDDLFPSALAGGRDALAEASLAVLDTVAAEARACRRCGLCDTRKQAVPGVGSARSGIVFVGEAPGADEDARGEPFVGRAGELLTRMIAAMDEKQLIPGVKLSRETVYIANVLKCRPPENRNPLPHEIESCSPYLLRQLEALQPRIICCLGKFAAELLLRIKGSVGGMRGRTYRWRGAKLIVTYHPAYLLRSPSAKRPVWDDLQRLAQEYLTD